MFEVFIDPHPDLLAVPLELVSEALRVLDNFLVENFLPVHVSPTLNFLNNAKEVQFVLHVAVRDIA